MLRIADELRKLGYSDEIARGVAALIEEANRSGSAAMGIPEWDELSDQRRREIDAWLRARGYDLGGAGPDVMITKRP